MTGAPADPADNVATGTGTPPPDLGIEGLVDPVMVGRGGSGVVYRAVQPRLNRVVAVKVLDGFLDAQAWASRFEREGYAMGTVAGHPHIVTVLTVGTTAHGRPFLLMPFLEGGSLAEHVPIPWPTAVRQLIKVCGAVETAHRAGVLHRDIKPGNVLLSGYGEPLLADFGISRVAGGFETSEGLINASIPYAPPEILNGQPASAEGDVYSLGATLFCSITGRPPFAGPPGEALPATYVRITRDPVPDLRPSGVPNAVCQVVETALAKEPAERPRSAAALGRLLQDAQRGTGQPVTPMTLTTVDEDGTTVAVVPANPAPSSSSTPAGAGAPASSGPPAAPTTTTVPARTAPADGGTRVLPTMDPAPPPAGRPSDQHDRDQRRRPAWIAAGVLALVVVLGAGFALWPRDDTPPTANGADVLTLQEPSGIAVASDGTVFIADRATHQVQRVSADGEVDTYVGTGEFGNSGNGRAATAATIEFPAALALAGDGTLFLASAGLVRRVDPQGIIGPVDGLGSAEGGIIALAAQPDGTLYAADRTSLFVRTPDGVVTPVAGPAQGFGHIESIAVHPEGWVAVSDSARDQIIRLDPDTGDTTPIAGIGPDAAEPRDDGYPATDVALSDPTGVAFHPTGALYLSEGGMNRVRAVQADGTLLTVAGDPEGYSAGDTGDGGPAIEATFQLLNGPLAFTTDGQFYLGDVLNHRVREVTPEGTVRPFP